MALILVLSPALEETVMGNTISGRVVDDRGNGIPNALVRVQTTPIVTQTDQNGYFTLTNPGDGEIKLTAWAKGFFITGPFLPPEGKDLLTMTLNAHSLEDNSDYQWVSAYLQEGEEDNCQKCHSNPADEYSLLPFDEWIHDAHANSAQNPRFLSMYLGTDLDGNQSPYRQFAWDRDYGLIPLPPDPDVPYYGPGFKLDFPGIDGNCATCHAPLKAVNDPHSTNPLELTGVHAEGVNCDFCHKIWDVTLDEDTNLPRKNMTGVLSYTFLRPPDGHQFFAGPLDDVAPGEDTYLPLQSESAFCAPCHHAVFGDTVIYNSYGEWLESPYSDPETGQTCQECHMPLWGADHFALLDQGGLIRDSTTLRSHLMTGVEDIAFMQAALSMTMDTAMSPLGLSVEVTLTNDNTGHHIPTGNPMRHMILVVNALDKEGTPIPLVQGPTLPEWCGDGEDEDDFAGMPGMVFAKVLEDTWSREYPSGAYWNDIRLVSDNRIAAFASDTSTYLFDAVEDQDVMVVASLYYRRAFKKIMEQKGWDVPDMPMKELKIQTAILTPTFPDITITTSSNAVVYGTTDPNHIIIESGAKVELLNFSGQNTIQIQSDSSEFTVSRSGASVTFTGSGGTILKMPATKDTQIISFSDGERYELRIHDNQVKLDNQEITQTSSPIDGAWTG